MPPFFSIVIPTYNRSRLLLETVESVRAQTFQDYELLIVDDGSNDDTAQVMADIGDPRIRYIRQDNAGRSVARNRGVREAKGHWTAFQDSDDLWLPNHLSALVQVIESHADAQWVYSLAVLFDEQGRYFQMHGNVSGDVLRKLLVGNFLCTPAIAVRSPLAKAEPFNEHPEIGISEDWELWVRLAAQQPLYCTGIATCRVRIHSGRSVLGGVKARRAANVAAESLLNRPELAARVHPHRNYLLGHLDLYCAGTYYFDGDIPAARRHIAAAIRKSPGLAFSPRAWGLLLKTLVGVKTAGAMRAWLHRIRCALHRRRIPLEAGSPK